ncbi:S1C family serine protease [Massiliimalia massiliensis]|uniref:S1C family serine protease n=1 Tax=Massiliimalia massiliensis TaxID=1852384 RepID=UPI0013566AD1|nr:trypsin-like peptidase domain-containing protein [Massiliimalia massiliensis]
MRKLAVWFSAALAVLLFVFPVSVQGLSFDAEELYHSVFVIYSGQSMGSGFSIDNGCIITNAHVIQDREHVTVNSYDGAAYAASLLAMNEEMDIAVLGVKESSFPSLAVASDEGMQIGDDVYAIGAPNSLDYTLTKGIISSGHRMIGGYSFIQANIALNSGNSGGPLLNAKGEVIGVNSMKLSDTEGIGFAIPMETVLDYLEETGLHGSSVQSAANETNAPEPVISETGSQISDADSQPFPENESTHESGSGIRVAVIAVSLAGACILLLAAVILVYRKNRTQKRLDDPAERTDFEIEIQDDSKWR